MHLKSFWLDETMQPSGASSPFQFTGSQPQVPSPANSGEKVTDRPDAGAFQAGSMRHSADDDPQWTSRSAVTPIQQRWPLIFRLFLSFVVTALISLPRTQASDRKEAQPLSAELHTRCLEILRKGLQSEEFWPAMHAAEAMTLAGAGNEVILALRDRVPQEKDDQHRCGLARELARAGDKQQLETLFQILADLQSTGRTHAAESLYKVRAIGDGELLRAAMRQSDTISLQVMAAGALATSGDEKAFSFLRANLRSKDQTARNLSAWILARLGNESDCPPMLAALLDEQDEMSRAFLAAALACLGNEKGRTGLGLQLSSENVTARTMAAEFVGHSRSIEFRDKLIELLDDPALDVRVRSVQSLIALSMPVAGP